MNLRAILSRAAAALTEIHDNPALLEERKLRSDAGNDVARTAVKRLDALKDRFRDDMQGHLNDVLAGRVSPEKALNQMTAQLRDAWRKSYSSGKARILGEIQPLNASDVAYLNRAVEAEVGFLRGFMQQVAQSGGQAAAGKMPFQYRMDLYADSLNGPHWNAWVEYLDSDTEIWWQLGIADHCEDCLALSSMSPWTKLSLPCTPGSGDSKCQARCKCSLFYRTVKKRKKAQPARPRKVNQIWSVPTPPKGLSVPAAEQQLAISALRQEVDYWRRAIQDASAAGDAAAEARAIAARKAANAKLIDFTKANKLWSPPGHTVNQVLQGKSLDERLVSDLFDLGLDGQTIAGMPAETFREIADSILADSRLMDARVAKVLKGGD